MLKWCAVWLGVGVVLTGCDRLSPHVPNRADCDLVAEIAAYKGKSPPLAESPGRLQPVPNSLDWAMGNDFGVEYPEDSFIQHYARCRKIEAGGGL